MSRLSLLVEVMVGGLLDFSPYHGVFAVKVCA